MSHDDLSPHRDEHARIENRLRAALQARAEQAAPSHRLDLILDQAGAQGGSSRSRATGWTLALVAAALVAALAIAMSGVFGGTPAAGPLTPGGPATTPVSTATDEPTGSETEPVETEPVDEPTDPVTDPAPETEIPTSGPIDTALAALPVYYPAHIGDDLRMVRLFREWINVEGVLRDAPTQDRLVSAVTAAMHATPPGVDGYSMFWSDQDLDGARYTPEQITLTVSSAGPDWLDAEEARIAVQQLVWTAQAAIGQGLIPVRFEISDGSDTLFGHISVDQDFNRPPSSDLYHQDLAPIWINSPTRYEALEGPDIVIKGEATVFEATFNWELIDGNTGSVLRSGFGTASVGGPGRGTYEIPLTGLADGLYHIRVFELSMEDGDRVSAERTIAFFVGPLPADFTIPS